MLAADAFLSFLAVHGLAPAGRLEINEGEVVRFRVDGDKAGSRNGWCVLHSHPVPWGIAGSWKTGEQHHWKDAASKRYTAAERAEQRRQVAAAREVREKTQAELHAQARERAARLWRAARPATDAHPYLQRKAVRAYGLKQLRDALLVPARSADGQLHTLQFISTDGGKRFLTGGRIGGCYCAIGQPAGVLLICEGYATAASLHEATGVATAAAFSAGNLARVALALRGKFPKAKIVICGDDDAMTPGNPGRAAAMAAARAVGGAWALPRFGGAA